MADCGCGSTYTPSIANVYGEQSNADGKATWGSPSAGDSPAVLSISGRSPYGDVPMLGGVSFCRKCLLTWAGVFLILALIFFNRK